MSRRGLIQKKQKIQTEFGQLKDEETLNYIKNVRRSQSYPEELLRESFARLSTKLLCSNNTYTKNSNNNNNSTSNSTDKPVINRARMKSCGQLQSALVTVAIREGDSIQLWRLLNRKDVDINHIDGLGMQPIHYVCMYGELEILKILLHFQADIHSTTGDGTTALEIAVREGNFELAQYLMNKGAKAMNIVNGMSREPARRRSNTMYETHSTFEP